MEEKTILMVKEENKAEEQIMDIDGIEFKSTKEGMKFLETLLAKHNELNHSKKKKERQTGDEEDRYTKHEKTMKEKFEPGSVSIEKIDHQWNMELPDNIHHALGVNNGDHIRFEAVDRETFKISKIR